MIIDNYTEVNKTRNGVFPHMYRKNDEKLYKEFMSKASPETLKAIIQKYQEYAKQNNFALQIIIDFAQKGNEPKETPKAIWYDVERDALIQNKNGIEFIDVLFHPVAENKEETYLHATIICKKPVREISHDDGERE